ncbi:tautomerase family protein [Basilea psittacipulmonis]|uniref:Uncharacterized protein n=1 Tax=Basilea psittacipulmonis DSM 24701 TaxID=1072685 RepID=A0A077DHE1_9BURK|nr:tautomerase family protein [Basilea psittacipulmonis]AIL32937.1 hypothetical protein IX83_06075 [Basilea psittacipulmonis DSM 24701]
MPFLQVQTNLALDVAQQEALIEGLAKATETSLSAPVERIVVTLNILSSHQTFVAGKMAAPLVLVNTNLKEGRSLALKQALLAALSDVIEKTLHIEKSSYRIMIHDLVDGTFC